MIHDFQPARPLEPENHAHFQWAAAIGSGAIAGIILLVLPRGNPWSALTFFAPVIVGRLVPASLGLSWIGAATSHLALSLSYGLIISRVVSGVTQFRAVLLGGATGAVLYQVNRGVVSLWIPELRGHEFSVSFAHIVFGLIAAGAYRGLLRRRPASAPTEV